MALFLSPTSVSTINVVVDISVASTVSCFGGLEDKHTGFV